MRHLETFPNSSYLFSNHTREEQICLDTYMADLLVEKLAQPQDLDEIIATFDRGDALVRDIADYTANQRNSLLDLGRTSFLGHDNIPPTTEQAKSITQANHNFMDVMQSKREEFHSLAGNYFQVDLEGFLHAKQPWATHIDILSKEIMENNYVHLDHIVHANTSQEENPAKDTDQFFRHVWQIVSKQYPKDLAWYLAERSQYGENWQRSKFMKEMSQAKRGAAMLITTFAEEFNLPQEYTERAVSQVKRTDFSALDQLFTSESVVNDKVYGDYLQGTLRIEVKLGHEGPITTRPTRANDPPGTVSHEVFHASSAQSKEEKRPWRIGLASGNVGTDANEGMTELLASLSLGRIHKFTDTQATEQSYSINSDSASHFSTYIEQTKAVLTLLDRQPKMFGSLFQAYYGFVPDQARLGDALALFDLHKSSFHASI